MFLFFKNIYVWIIISLLASGGIYAFKVGIEIDTLKKEVDTLGKELNISKAETLLSSNEASRCKVALSEQNLAIEKLRVENVSLSEKERKNLAEIRKLKVKPTSNGVREFYEDIFDSLNRINRD